MHTTDAPEGTTVVGAPPSGAGSALAARVVARFPALAPRPDCAVAVAAAALGRWGDDPAQAWAVLGAAAAVHPELEAVLAGRARALAVAWPGAVEAAVYVEALRALGLCAAAADDGAVVAARDPGTVAELLRWYATPDRASRPRIVQAIGQLLGLPSCCVDAMAARAGSPDPPGERAPFLRRPGEALAPLVHRLGRVRAIAHVPCSPACGGSVALGEQALGLLCGADPAAADRLLDALAQPVLLVGRARVELDAEWIGDSLEVERACALDAGDSADLAWEAVTRVELSADGVRVLDRSGGARVLSAPRPLFTVPGRALAPAARAALGCDGPDPAGDALTGDAAAIGWLLGDGPRVFQGYAVGAVRGGERMEVTFTRGDRVVLAWLTAAGERPAFRKGAHVAIGHDGEVSSPEVALLRALWERVVLDEPRVLAAMAAAAGASPARSTTPRHARPAQWRGAGPPPPLRLRVLGAEEAERFFHVDYEYGAAGPGEAAPKPTSRIGIIYRCNQWCSFCDLAEMDVKLSPETVKAAIDGSRARGSERLILTGGEPTLSPHLVEYVRHAKSAGFSEIVLQTNAVRLSRGELVRELVDAGLTTAQVSIHGADAALSDRLTQAPGTHERTLRGIDNLVAAGVACLLNHLIFRDNAPGLGAFVELARARWGHRPDLVVLQFRSPNNEFERPEEARAQLAPYSAFVGPLLEARALARAYGFGTSALLDPTGVPSLCVLAAHGADVPAVAREHGAVHHHAWESGWFTRVEACRACGVSGACQGVRRDYVELFGAGEFAPLPAGAAGRADDPA